jgi:iron complex outermembrane receptor protein
VSAQEVPGPLDRRITVKFDRVELGVALARLRAIYGVPLAYSPEAVPAGRLVSIAADDQAVGQILALVLDGTGLRVVPIGGGTIVVAPGLQGPVTASERSPVPDIASGIRELDQIVVMGTPAAGAPERDNPTAVSVVRGADLKNYHFSRTAELFRNALPGIVLWDQGPSGPPAEIAAVRGASSFTARGLKTYLDGVEIASPALVTLLDPRSIERIEVIRGPQGAALYGSDAINGVIQIVTRKGSLGEAQKLQATAGIAAGPFDQQATASTRLRQDYAGGVTWGGTRASVAASGNMGRVGTTADAPFTRNWSAQGGAQVALGSLLISGSARGGQMDFAEDLAAQFPLGATAAAMGSARSQVDVGTIGVTAVHQLSRRFVQTLVAGYDRAGGALGSQRSSFASYRLPLDASHETTARTSIRYSVANSLDFRSGASLVTTVGLEHARLSYSRGSWDTYLADQYVELYQDRVRNSGAFGQAKLRAGPLLVTGGVRAEWSSSFGADVGTALAPSVGISWTRPIGDLALRLRSGWGKGLRPPEPGMSRAMATARVRQEANANLAPESQAGIEFGADLYAGTDGYARVTYFNQLASDLIQGVIFPTVGTKPSYQFQNVGAIRNSGVELEGGLRFGRVGIDALYYRTNSVVERLARTYSGYLQVGDRLPEVPDASGSARISYAGRKVQLAFGATYLGSWTGHDWAAIAQSTPEMAPLRPSQRDYLIRYPGLIKPYLNMSFDVARQFTAYLSIDNLTKSDNFERHNGNPPAGRSVMVGLEVRP